MHPVSHDCWNPSQLDSGHHEECATHYCPRCHPVIPKEDQHLTTGRYNSCFSHLFYLNPSLLLLLLILYFSSSLDRYFQPASRKNISLKLSVLKPRLESLCVEYLPLLEQWCNCSAMSAPACLSSCPLSCDCWVMSPCQLCHCRDTHCNHINKLE